MLWGAAGAVGSEVEKGIMDSSILFVTQSSITAQTIG